MPLTPDQVAEAKKQLSQQIAHLPADQKAQAQKQIDDMSGEAIEELIRQQQSQGGDAQPIFRMIVEGKIPSKKIAETVDAIAVLSTKAISKGHTVIIPKNAVSKSYALPASAFNLAKSVSAKVIEVLGAEGTEIQTQFMFGEMIVHVIPVYDTPVSINSEAKEADEKELEKLAEQLYIPMEKKAPKVVKKSSVPKSVPEEKVVTLKRKVP